MSQGIRKFAKIGVFVLAALVFSWVVWTLSTSVSKFIFRPQVKDTAFGALAQPSFTQLYSPLTAKSWQIDTDLPPSQEKIQVFQIIKGQFLEDQQKKIEKELGLTGKGDQLDTGITKYGGGETTLILNSAEGQYNYKVEYTNPVKNFIFSRLNMTEDDVVGFAEGILKKQQLLTDDLKNGKIETNMLLINGKTKQKISAANANAAEIFFHRKAGALFGAGDPMVRMLIGGSDRKILELDYSYYYLDPYGSFYPVITSSQAWSRMEQGKAFADNIPNQDSVKVTNVELSYWESTLSQSYIQPVWVFDCIGKVGDKETAFKAYLPAVTSSFLVSSE